MRFFVLLLLFPCVVFAQKRHTVSGYVKDGASGETLIGANIAVNGNKGIVSNQYGFYSITLLEGEYDFTVTYIGYRGGQIKLNLISDTIIDFKINTNTGLSTEVIVTTRKRDNNVRTAQMGKVSLPIEQIKSIPAFFGECIIHFCIQIIEIITAAIKLTALFNEWFCECIHICSSGRKNKRRFVFF